MNKYHIYGRPGTGSLIAEYLFRELNIDYKFTFIDKKKAKTDPEFLKMNPAGRIPVLVIPNGEIIFETLAILYHIADNSPSLSPNIGDPLRDKYNQYLSMMATGIYPAYHRQYHSYQYTSESAYNELRRNAQSDQAILYDYIEKILDPYLCEEQLTAADFYLYMLSSWDKNPENLVKDRPKLKSLINEISLRSSVVETEKNHNQK